MKQLYAGSRNRPDLGEPLRIPRPRPEVAEQPPAPAEPEAPELSSREDMLAFFGKTDPTAKG